MRTRIKSSPLGFLALLALLITLLFIPTTFAIKSEIEEGGVDGGATGIKVEIPNNWEDLPMGYRFY